MATDELGGIALGRLTSPGVQACKSTRASTETGEDHIANEEAAMAQQWHATYYLALAEQAEPKLRGAEQQAWLLRLEAEHDNLRAVLAWSQTVRGSTELGVRLAGALWWFWWVRGYSSEGRMWLEQALAAGSGEPAVRAQALLGASWLTRAQDDVARAAALVTESLALYRELGDQRGTAEALRTLGLVAYIQGDIARATPRLEEGLELYRALGDTSGIAFVLNGLGELARWQGDYGRAVTFYAETLAIQRKLGHKLAMAHTLHNLGHVAHKESDDARAAACFAESLALFRELGNKLGVAFCLAGMAGVVGAHGQPEQAARLFGAAEALLVAIGDGLDPIDRVEYEHNVAAVRAQLDEGTFASAWAEGRTMSLEQAIAEAFRDRT